MGQEDYRACMSAKMGGGRLKGLSKEERKLEFCTIAKQCSKGVGVEEGRKLCQEAATNPKPPKTRKGRGRSFDTAGLASCIIQQIDTEPLTVESLSALIASCTGQKSAKPLTRERFIKQCFKEHSSTGTLQIDIKEAQKLRSICTAAWKEQENSS